MTAHYIAQACERNLASLTEDNVYKYNFATSLLDSYLRRNFTTFIETELVYKWAKPTCIVRIEFENWYRSRGWLFGTKEQAYKTYLQRYNKTYL